MYEWPLVNGVIVVSLKLLIWNTFPINQYFFVRQSQYLTSDRLKKTRELRSQKVCDAVSGMAGSRCKPLHQDSAPSPHLGQFPLHWLSSLAASSSSVVPSTSRLIVYRPSIPEEGESFISNECDKCPRMKFFWLVQGHVSRLTSL